MGLDAAEARHWMSLRRMATGRTAAGAFIVGPGGQTTGAAARNVWDISLRAARHVQTGHTRVGSGHTRVTVGPGKTDEWPPTRLHGKMTVQFHSVEVIQAIVSARNIWTPNGEIQR